MPEARTNVPGPRGGFRRPRASRGDRVPSDVAPSRTGERRRRNILGRRRRRDDALREPRRQSSGPQGAHHAGGIGGQRAVMKRAVSLFVPKLTEQPDWA